LADFCRYLSTWILSRREELDRGDGGICVKRSEHIVTISQDHISVNNSSNDFNLGLHSRDGQAQLSQPVKLEAIVFQGVAK